MTKMRPIEIGIAWDSGSWTTDHIEIPADTLEENLSRVCQSVWGARMKLCRETHESPEEMGYGHIWVYNSMEDSRAGIIFPNRLTF